MELDRTVDPQEKALVSDWNKRLKAALKRVEPDFKRFKENRRLLAGKTKNDSGEATKMRSNLFFANMAAILPQVYAKDPEFSCTPTKAVGQEQMQATKVFASTAEIVLTKCLVKDAGLKKQSKKTLRSTFATSVGWLKLSWQEKRETDPLILNQIKDTQDNIARAEMLRAKMDDPQACSEQELIIAQLQQTIEGLQTQQEITIARGLALDFIKSEDVIVIDDSVQDISDYTIASALGHRVWMTPEKYQLRFGYKPTKAKTYTELNGTTQESKAGEANLLLCVWEIWSQDDNRMYYVCDGEEGFCEPPSSPDWSGKRWYPFFLYAVNEIDGSFYPLSDIELTEGLVAEYNQNREDFVRDRKGALPVNIVRKGSSLTPADIENIKNRNGTDIIVVDGVPTQPLSNDIFIGTLASLNAANYDTAPARQDMEMIIGGGDAARGTVMKAKTATEAEIVSQGLRGRNAERQDIFEDMLNEIGPYALEILLRKMTAEEVMQIAGPESQWPSMDIDQIFNLVSVEVRGGSTGKPDRLQEQDRWTKLMPVIENAVAKVAELRAQGQTAMADALIKLAQETLRRFDERLDIKEFLPAEQGQEDPGVLKQKLVETTQTLEQTVKKLRETEEKIERGYVEAAAQIATSNEPVTAMAVFQQFMQQIGAEVPPMPEEELPPEAALVSPEPAQLQ